MIEENEGVCLSIIIPFQSRCADIDCIKRLDNAIKCFWGQSEVEVVVYDTGKNFISGYGLNTIDQNNFCYLHFPRSGVFSPGCVRNHAINEACGRFVFLLDADLLISHQAIDALFEHINIMEKEGPQAFRMFPCLYLSENYTRTFAEQFAEKDQQSQLYDTVVSSYLRGEVDKVDGIALTSSCLLMRRDWFMALGGFRDCFAGHGCEDFDLIHRLAAYYPIGAKPADYTLDEKQQFPADYQGFRRYYSHYALPHLFNKQFLLHQWHPRPLTKDYHRRRSVNEHLFAEVLAKKTLALPAPMANDMPAAVLEGLNQEPFNSDKPLPDFQQCIRELQQQQGYPVEKYPGMFRWAEGVKKRSGGFRRKARKLYMNPKQFFKDIQWKQ